MIVTQIGNVRAKKGEELSQLFPSVFLADGRFDVGGLVCLHLQDIVNVLRATESYSE